MVWDTVTEQQFLERLETSPNFRDEVRRRVLSAELIAMPENLAKTSAQLAELSGKFGMFADEQKEINTELRSGVAELKSDVTELKSDVTELKSDVTELKSDVTELKSDVTELKSDVTELKSDVTELKSDVTELKSDVTELKSDVTELKESNIEMRSDIAELKESNVGINKTLNRIQADIGELKGNAAYWPMLDQHERILEHLNLKYMRFLNRQELMGMLKELNADDVNFGDRQSFYKADLVIEASEVQDPKATRYVAVEASYTADRRDTDRAVCNADLLTRCTGHKAFAVVASVRNDRDILPLIETGEVIWYQLFPKDFQAR